MLDWQRLGNLVPERERHIHGKLAQPVSGDAVAAWRRKLNAAECFAMEACLQKDLRRTGLSAALFRRTVAAGPDGCRRSLVWCGATAAQRHALPEAAQSAGEDRVYLKAQCSPSQNLAIRRQPSASDVSSVAVLTRRYGLMPYAAPCTVATCASPAGPCTSRDRFPACARPPWSCRYSRRRWETRRMRPPACGS